MLPLSMQYGPLTTPSPLKAKTSLVAPPYCINYQPLIKTRFSDIGSRGQCLGIVDTPRQSQPVVGEAVEVPRQREPMSGIVVDDPRRHEPVSEIIVDDPRQHKPMAGQAIEVPRRKKRNTKIRF